MQYSSLGNYLKQVKMQRFYVNKFMYNYANHNDLTNVCKFYINELDKEIKFIEDIINRNKEKYKKNQTTIFDFIKE